MFFASSFCGFLSHILLTLKATVYQKKKISCDSKASSTGLILIIKNWAGPTPLNKKDL